MEYIKDTTYFPEFLKHTLVLGITGWIFGQTTEKIVGSSGMLIRLLVNSLILYAMLIYAPHMTSHLQNTLPGLVFCATFLNNQKWDTTKWI